MSQQSQQPPKLVAKTDHVGSAMKEAPRKLKRMVNSAGAEKEHTVQINILFTDHALWGPSTV